MLDRRHVQLSSYELYRSILTGLMRLYVDKNNPFTYDPGGTPLPNTVEADGTFERPFKTIKAAVRAASDSGVNTLDSPHIIDIIGPGTYDTAGDLDFSTIDSFNLVNLILEGHGAIYLT